MAFTAEDKEKVALRSEMPPVNANRRTKSVDLDQTASLGVV